MSLIPYGGLTVVGGAGTVALTTAATKVAVFSASGGGTQALNTNTMDGDASVVPDRTNNRILLSPGLYVVQATLSGTTTGGADIEIGVQKAGSSTVDVTDLKARQRFSTSLAQVTLSGSLSVNASDNPKTLSTFPDPAASGFSGAGGAPKTLVPVELTARILASTDTLTVVTCQFSAFRLA